MAQSALVVGAFVALRDALTTLSTTAGSANQRRVLGQRAIVAGQLAEDCDSKFGDGDVPGGEQAIAQADRATQLAGHQNQTEAQVSEVIAAATTANGTLGGILNGAGRVPAAGGLRGSLRVAPPPVSRQPATRGTAPTAPAKPAAQSQPAYMTSVALLFPVEAAALFPIGRNIATTDVAWTGVSAAYIMVLVVALICAFIAVIRYFATQVDGQPSVKEILLSIISFLLWAGALGGYWLPEGGFPTVIPEKIGSQIFAFMTIMWVAIVPYFVRKPSATGEQP